MSCDELVHCEHLNELKDRVRAVEGELITLRSDVHQISTAVEGMRTSLDRIASTMEKLTDLPETWQALKGWWKVMNWFKQNITILVLIVLLLLSFTGMAAYG